VSRLVNKCGMFEAALDIGGGLGPAEGLGVLVPGCEPIGDRGLQPPKAAEAAAADGLTGNQGEPAFPTRLSHDALAGVKWRWKRGWAVSHCFTAGCLRVP
jgi:hypothetical protein